MAKKKPPDKKRGSARMKEFGYKKVELWLDARELEAVFRQQSKHRQPDALAPLFRRIICEWAGIEFNAR